MRYMSTLMGIALLVTMPIQPQKLLIEETLTPEQTKRYIAHVINSLFGASELSDLRQHELQDLIHICIDAACDELEQDHETIGAYCDRVEVDSIIHEETVCFVKKHASLYAEYYIKAVYAEKCSISERTQKTLHRLTIEKIKREVDDILTGDQTFFALKNYIGDDLDKQAHKIILSYLKQDCIYNACSDDCSYLLLLDCGHSIHKECLLERHSFCQDRYQDTTCPCCGAYIQRDFDAMQRPAFINDIITLFS